MTALEVLEGLFERVAVVREGEDVDVEPPVDKDVEPPRGAVDCPAICAWTVEENVPVILLRLFRLKIVVKYL